MPRVSDLVRDSKLETTFDGRYTQHVYHVPGANPRKRKVTKRERWERCKNIGSGSFGIVCLEKLITDSDENTYRAVKEIRKDIHQRAADIDYHRELEAIAKFSHKNYNVWFVKSFGWYENSECVFITMEYFPLGDLQRHISLPLSEKDTQQITEQILEGLLHMHDNGFAHRDLKPNNILVESKDPWSVKIGDFGICKRVEEGLTVLRTFNGAHGFFAPEILALYKLLDDNGKFGPNKEYTVAVDIWSLGEIVFRTLTGSQAFSLISLGKYVRGDLLFPTGILQKHNVSEEGCDFLNSLMAPMPEDRVTAKDALSHIWIKELPSSRASAETRRSSPITREAIPSEYPTEASARWSTADATTTESDTLANPMLIENSPTILQPTQNTASTATRQKQGSYNELAASTSRDKTIRLQSPATKAVRRTFKYHTMAICDVAFSPDGKLGASASQSTEVKLWDPATGLVSYVLEGHSDGVLDVTFSPDSKLVASSSGDKTIMLWDSSTGLMCDTLKSHSSLVWCVAFSPDGKLMASGSEDKTVRLWDSATRRVRHILKGHSDGVLCVAFSPEDKLVASGSADKTIRLWDSTSGKVRRKLKGHSDCVWSVVFSLDGKLVVSGSTDKTIKLWNSATGAVCHTFKGHSDVVWGVAFSPDGKLLASASQDNTVRFWNPATGAEVYRESHSSMVHDIAFSPDGKLVASASDDGTIKFWDPTTRTD